MALTTTPTVNKIQFTVLSRPYFVQYIANIPIDYINPYSMESMSISKQGFSGCNTKMLLACKIKYNGSQHVLIFREGNYHIMEYNPMRLDTLFIIHYVCSNSIIYTSELKLLMKYNLNSLEILNKFVLQ